MLDPKHCAALILAAGQSKRYGHENKLLAPLDNQPLVSHICQTIRSIGFGEVHMVASDEDVAEVVAGFGFTITRVDGGQPQGASLVSAAKTHGDVAAVMVFLGDMPYVPAAHIKAMLGHAKLGSTLATRAQGYFGPPVLVPPSLLRSVDPAADRGAGPLIAGAASLEVDAHLVRDFDRPEDFEDIAR